MNLLRRSIVTLVASCTAALVVTAAAPGVHAAPPAARPTNAAAKPGASPLAPAIDALVKEYQTSLKEKKGALPREKCDYFSEQSKPEGVTPEIVMAVLEKPLTGSAARDPRAEAYVKWQLLSALDGKFPDALKERAIRAYRNAPSPTEHPARNRQMMDRRLFKIGINNADAEVGINQDLSGAIDQYRLYIEPILEYRDEFYNRLPGGFERLVAGVEDTFDRVSRGAPATEFWRKVGAEVRSWALTSSEPQQMYQMSVAIRKLNAYVKDEQNKPVYRVIYANEGNYQGLKWQSQSTIDQEGRYVGELGEWLEERAQNPAEGGGGLKFKDGDDMKKGKK